MNTFMRGPIKIGAPLALLAFAGIAAAGSPPPSPLTLAAGTYKFSGRCTKLTVLAHDFPYQCENYAGIVADNPLTPDFVFAVGGKAWLYSASGPAAFSQDGTVATYPITEMIDSVAERKYVYPGQCVLSALAQGPLLHCTMWRDTSHSEVTREIEFTGDGNWAFSKSQRP